MEVNGETVVQLPVTVDLHELQQGSVSISTLEEAFGPSSLGLIIVQNLPSKYLDLRGRVLSYASYLANLPSPQLAQVERPDAKYLVGWSLGKETLKSGRYDTLKGSYYVNCAFYQSPELQSAPSKNYEDFPEYTAPNAWPPEAVLPGFRSCLEELCSLIIDTAVLVAKACDRYGVQKVEGYEDGYLEHMVQTSMTTKARLLHYFPNCESKNTMDSATTDVLSQGIRNQEEAEDWCATHIDHGCLTGLTSAMYVDETTNAASIEQQTHANDAPTPLPELPASPDPNAGLYIHSRTGRIVKVSIPRDSLAFQTGQALEVITRGKFRAVPHFVRGVAGGSSDQRIARNTLAVFTQPNLWELVDRERGVDFASFAKSVVDKGV